MDDLMGQYSKIKNEIARNIKSTNEAMRCLVFYTGKLVSISHSHPDESRREDAEDIISLLTPVIKSYLTERGFLNISEAMQVCGGAGYDNGTMSMSRLSTLRVLYRV